MAVTCGFTGLRHHAGHEPAGQRGCECVRGGIAPKSQWVLTGEFAVGGRSSDDGRTATLLRRRPVSRRAVSDQQPLGRARQAAVLLQRSWPPRGSAGAPAAGEHRAR